MNWVAGSQRSEADGRSGTRALARYKDGTAWVQDRALLSTHELPRGHTDMSDGDPTLVLNTSSTVKDGTMTVIFTFSRLDGECVFSATETVTLPEFYDPLSDNHSLGIRWAGRHLEKRLENLYESPIQDVQVQALIRKILPVD